MQYMSTGLEENKQYSMAPTAVTFCMFLAQQSPVGQGFLIPKFIDHTQRRITVGRTPLDEWLVHRRDLYLTTHNNHNRKTSIPLWDSKSAGERPHTYNLDRAATGTGQCSDLNNFVKKHRNMGTNVRV
jgi:hypothetical protein